MTELVNEITQQVTRALASDNLELPVLPEIAMSVREALEDCSIDAKKMAVVIGQDPAISSVLVKVANSPAFRGARAAESLDMAITRIGLTAAAELSVGLAMKQMFQSTEPRVDVLLRSTWRRATEVAAMAGVSAKYFTKLQPGLATLAGLTHNIGALPVLTYAEEHPECLRDLNTLPDLVEGLHAELGCRIMAEWNFPSAIADVPLLYRDFARESNSADYVDVIQVAYLQVVSATAHADAQLQYAQLRSFQNLGLDPAEEHEDLNDQLHQAMSALQD